jgi:hypothetical protein
MFYMEGSKYLGLAPSSQGVCQNMAVLPFPMDRSMESYIEKVHIFNKDFPILPKRALGPSIRTMAILTLRLS